MSGQSIPSFEGYCFSKIEISLEEIDKTKFQLNINARGKKNLLCSDFMLFGNSGVFAYEMLFFEGVHKVTFDMTNTATYVDIKANGVQTFSFCEVISDEIISVINTLKLFAGGIGRNGAIAFFDTKVPDYLAEANKELIRWTQNWDMQERTSQDFHLSEDLIHSGDFIAILRLDGLDPMVMYGTGSRVGHTAIALWFEEDGKRELYFVES